MSVYYVAAPDLALVKIGYAADPLSRFSKIQSDSPVRLTLLAVEDGGEEIEAARHSQFSLLRARGEWFHFRSDLIAFLDTLTPFERPEKQESMNQKLIALGVSQAYASMIVSGKMKPSRPLAIHILRCTGWRHPSIADLTDAQIDVLEQVEPWTPRQDAA